MTPIRLRCLPRGPGVRRVLAQCAVLLALAACLGTAQAQKVVTFDHGTASAVLPVTFITTELNDGTLRAVFGPTGDHRLQIAMRVAASTAGTPDAGVQFVRTEAIKRNLRLFEYPGRVAFMQPAADVRDGDRMVRAALWHVGFGDNVAVIMLAGPAEPTPELRQFLGKPLQDLVASLQRRPQAAP